MPQAAIPPTGRKTAGALQTTSPLREKKPKLKRSRETTRSSTHRDSSSSRSSLRSQSPSPRKRSRKGKSPVRMRSWADRMSDSEEEEMEYNTVVLSNSEDGNQPESETKTRMVEVSEKTKRFLHEKSTQRVPNALRKEIRDNYPLPKVSATRTPMLDPMMKPEASAASKSMDKQLAKSPDISPRLIGTPNLSGGGPQ